MNHWLEKQQLKTKFIMHMSSSTQEVCPWRLRPHVAVQGAAPECKYAEKKQCLSFISSPCHTNKHTCTDNSPTHARTPMRTHAHSLRLRLRLPLKQSSIYSRDPGASGLSLGAVLQAHVPCGCNQRTMCSGTKLQRVPSLKIARAGKADIRKTLLPETQRFSEY